MKLFDLISMCLRNLTRRKFRTFLTVFGVVIGTTSIVTMISLGVGISVSIEQQLQNMGDLSIITVYPQSADNPLDENAVTAIQAIPGVTVAAPRMRFEPQSSMQLFAGRKKRYASWGNFVGVDLEAMKELGFAVSEGELELGGDGKKIKLLAAPSFAYQFEDTKKRYPNNRVDEWPDEAGNIAEPFFNLMEEDYVLELGPVKAGGKTLAYDMEMAGVLLLKENDHENRWYIFLDIQDLKRIKTEYERTNGIKKKAGEPDSYEQVTVKVDSINNVAAVQDQIKAMEYFPSSMEEIRENMQQGTRQIQLILGILGGVALLVAAISITNTMIMSVYERTREIGVMKVLGCLVGNIRTIFLMEAGLIGFGGGVLGVCLSYLLSWGLNAFAAAAAQGGETGMGMGMGMAEEAAKISIIPPWLILVGLAVATSIGLISGFYPANRAVRISALEAIKQE